MYNNIIIKIKWSIEVIIITILSLLLLFSVYAYVIRKIIISDQLNIGAVILTLIFLFCYANSPQYIKLNDSQFILKKTIGKITINYTQIKYLAPFSFSLSNIRFFGSGGVGGYLGFYCDERIGKYSSYVVNRTQTFLLVTQYGKKFVFSCQDYDTIADTIRNKLDTK